MPLTKFDLCSNALMLIGADTITDFAGGSTESAAAAQFFQTTADNWLSLYDWQFATTTVQLSRLGTAPLNAWDAAYQAPAGAIKIQNVKVNDNPIAYDRFADKIHCNASVSDVVHCDYTRSPEVSEWPPYFVELVECALAKKFSTVLAAKIDFKTTFNADMETQFRLAKNADARQQTTKRINMKGRGSIIEARRTGFRG
jgi:hypothetical protein